MSNNLVHLPVGNSSCFQSRNFAVDYQVISSGGISLGNVNYLTLGLTSSDMGLPDSSTVVSSAQSLGFPQVLAFATACIGIYMAVKILRSFNP